MTLFVVALALSFSLVGASIPVLRRAQFMDVPNHRSSHDTPVPRGGGIALLLAVVASFVLTSTSVSWTVLTVALALAVVGLIDDVRTLDSGVRLLAQVCAALAICVWLATDRAVDDWWLLVVAVVAIVGYVNAFNFMDGVNGISAMTTLVVGAYWTVAGHRSELDWLQAMGLAVAGGALGFLPWNAPRARVFLGDVGSYGLGLLLATLSAVAWVDGVQGMVAVAPLVVYGADTGWALVKRAVGGRPLTEAHREHVYQRLVDGGWSHIGAAGWCAAIVAAVCLTATLTHQDAPVLGFGLMVLLTACYLATPRFAVRAPVAGITA